MLYPQNVILTLHHCISTVCYLYMLMSVMECTYVILLWFCIYKDTYKNCLQYSGSYCCL